MRFSNYKERFADENQKQGAVSHQCYVSAITSTSITISGHPATLSRFIQSSEGIEYTWLPIHAPYHHGKTYASNCFQQIVQTMPNIDFSPLVKAKPRYDMYSPASGNIIKADSLLELLQTAVIECLRKPLRCDRIVNQCVSEIVEHNFTAVGFVAVNPASLVKSIAGSLSSETKALVSVDFMVSPMGEFGPSCQSKLKDESIAIVGIAGRFPGANNTEELWHVLEQGLDLHKTVRIFY
jgi:Starter unit:ACP transacylase in aflatoxin biosynthesis/Beta-ketoacyl synthase, N-terminal domain